MLARGALLAFLPAVLIAGCVAPQPAQPDPPTTPTEGSLFLNVRVVDLVGDALAGVEVYVVGTDLKEPLDNVRFFEDVRDTTRSQTDPDGTARFELEPGTWVVAADAADHYRVRQVVALADGPADIELVLPERAGPTVVAHRGGAHYAPENTLAAFRKALALGVDVVEFDVRLTADDEIVLMHDETVDRTTNGTGPVRAMTLAQLTALDAGVRFHHAFTGEPVPSLDDALALLTPTDVRLFVDVKATPDTVPDTIARTADVLRAWNVTGRAFVATTHAAAVEFCQAEGDLYCLFMVGADRTEHEAIVTFRALEPDGLRVRHDRLTPAVHDEVRAAGKDLFTGDANAPDQWRRAITLGVDYIGTDRPGDLLEYLAEDAVWRHAHVPA